MKNPSKYFGNELEYFKKVLNSESWSSTSGNWNQALELKFAEKLGSRYAVAFNSGTSTLHAALEAVGVRAGDEVISPALTVVMDTTATIHANAVPVYADIDPETFTVDPADIKKKITPKTKAIIVVSLYGQPADMDPIMKLARDHNLHVIEDNAQCVLSTYKGNMTGTIGHIGSYSFENTKHLSCGEGGIIITDSEDYAELARKIGGHGYKNLKAQEGRVRLRDDIFQNPNYKRHDVLGWNYRLSEFSAAIVLAQLENVEELIDMRVKTAEIFMNAMSSASYIIPQKLPESLTSSYYTLAVLYNGQEEIGISWEDFRSKYVDMGGDGFYGAWSVPYLEPVIANRQFVGRCPQIYNNIKYEKGLCPVAETIQPKIMQFKTNYRSIELAKSKAAILEKLIRRLRC